MKSNAYVFIDAHIIRCRLHHQNNLKYSVALKSGKDQQVATQYKPSKDLTIEMDTHLSLQADKHSYDNFPKLTLIVNVISDNGEKKTVGTTFANYRKEGLQIFQVSQCSCKDKAFEVDISFSLKIVEAKSSKIISNKNQLTQDKKSNYFSQQPTPRESRQMKQDRFAKPLKDNAKHDSQQKIEKLNKVKSEKILLGVKDKAKFSDVNVSSLPLQKEVQEMQTRIKEQQQQLQQMKDLQFELQRQRQSNEMLKQLLSLQQQKNSEAVSYILSLEKSALGLTPKDNSKSNVACVTSFKVIEEKDEIIEMNEQLLNQLQAEKEKNNFLQLEIDQLRQHIDRAKQAQVKLQERNKNLEQQLLKMKSEAIEPFNHEIPISSVYKEKAESSLEKEKIEELQTQVLKLQQKIAELKTQIDKLQSIRSNLLESPQKTKSPQKKAVNSKPIGKKEEQPRKIQKGPSSDKNWKPPIKSPKKIIQTPVSNIQISAKKSLDANSLASVDLMEKTPKVASTQIETKTDREESIQKSFDFLSIEQKSQKNAQKYNMAVYFTDGLQG